MNQTGGLPNASRLFQSKSNKSFLKPNKKRELSTKNDKTWYNRSARKKAENEEKACTLEDTMYKFKR
ncbi:MAG: hypothetical protein IJL32_04980, partial [Oscillospiraceae bacterium]|nr:hypothetical protein [Oscillospiraceae bacterium]